MDYSPNLKEAMAEIRAILLRRDIAGYILIHEPGFSEFLRAVDPSWSLVRVEGDALRLRSKLADFGGDAAAQLKANNDTVNLLVHLRESLSRDALAFHRLVDLVGKSWEIEEGESMETPRREH